MKKFLVLLLSLFALFGFTACDDNGNYYDNDYPDDAKRANVIQKIWNRH